VDTPTPPSTDRDLLEAFLASRDIVCPRCSYNLRGSASDRCPECGARLALSLSIASDDPRTVWDGLALIAVVLTGLYFATRILIDTTNLIAGALRGSTLAPLRAELATNIAIELVVTVIAVVWFILIIRNRAKRPRPIWARPTTAAAGLLLAIFTAFFLAYSIRSLL
jgi:DNA-directed RNA polymerase subunit RPC12/RpoP